MGSIFARMSFNRVRFREIREKYGSREKLSFSLNEKPSVATLRNWEQTSVSPSVDDLARVCKVIGTTVAYVMDEISDPSPDALKALNAYSKEARKIIEMPYEPEFEKWAIEEMSLEELQKAAKETNERLIVYELKDAAKRLQAAILKKTIKDENLPKK